MANISGLSLIPSNEITEACFAWCEEQHFVNDYHDMFLVLFTITALAISLLLFTFRNHIPEPYQYLNNRMIMLFQLLSVIILFIFANRIL